MTWFRSSTARPDRNAASLKRRTASCMWEHACALVRALTVFDERPTSDVTVDSHVGTTVTCCIHARAGVSASARASAASRARAFAAPMQGDFGVKRCVACVKYEACRARNARFGLRRCAKRAGQPHCCARRTPQVRRSSTRCTRCSGPFIKMSCARGRVVAMFWRRLSPLISRQMRVATSFACSSSSAA